ncbi:MAG: glycosyltransferase [Butyrivibrio sp.]|nr:glycosyltransferase [Butyrivibrio sp.]
MKNKIAVLLSSYNGAKYLDEQLNSIFEQKGNFDITILVRDDGSNDSSIHLLKKYEMEKKIILFLGDNIGSAKSFKWLINTVGIFDYYALADQDDVWKRDKLLTAVKFLEENKEVLLYGSNKIIVDSELNKINIRDNVYHTGFYNLLVQGPGIAGCTMVFDSRLRNLFINAPANDFYHDALLVILGEAFGNVYYDLNGKILYRNHDNNVFGSRMNFKSRFMHRLLNFTTYSNRKTTTNIAKFLNNYSYKKIENNKRRIVVLALMAKKNWTARMIFFLQRGLKTTHVYEFFMYKLGIILGWI